MLSNFDTQLFPFFFLGCIRFQLSNLILNLKLYSVGYLPTNVFCGFFVLFVVSMNLKFIFREVTIGSERVCITVSNLISTSKLKMYYEQWAGSINIGVVKNKLK